MAIAERRVMNGRRWALSTWTSRVVGAGVLAACGCHGIYNDVASATSVTEHHDLEANGLDHTLYAEHAQSGVTTAAIPSPGVPYHLVVSRHDAYDAICNDVLPPRSAPVHVQGGGFPRTCTDRSPQKPAIELVSAECDDNACVVQPVSNTATNEIELDVVVPKEMDATLHVRVRRRDGAAAYEDRFPLTVRAPNRIFAADHSTAPVAHAMLPGAQVSLAFSLYWNDRSVEAGPNVVFETTTPPTTAGGDVIARAQGSSGARFVGVADHAGSTSVTVAAAGLSRTLPLRVVSESDVVKIGWNHAVYTSDQQDQPGHDPSEDPVGAPYTEHTLKSGHDDVTLLMVLTLADGSVALGGVGRLTVLPSAKPPVRIGVSGTQKTTATASFLLSQDFYGSGSVIADIGSAHFSWDVTSTQ